MNASAAPGGSDRGDGDESAVAGWGRLQRSLAVRLSVWFAALFAIGFTAIFALLFWTLARQLETRETEALEGRLQQYASVYAASGLQGLRLRVAQDSQEPNVRSLFVRLVGREGDAIWGKIPADWIEEEARAVAVPDGWGGWTQRRTYSVRVPQDAARDLVLASRVLFDGRLLQVGRTTDSREVLLEPLRRTFLWVGAGVVVVGFGAGVFAARRATKPLRDVVATAQRIIRTGALDARVPLPQRNDDVAELVRAFNTVLDKNAALLRAMREALDNVAHDLRTPLTRLRGTAELALQNAENRGPQAEALADCVEQADDVLRLLRALMEISEAEAGMLRLEKTETDLAALARDAVELYADVADAKSVALSVEAAAAVPVLADATRLRQAIANLIDNAVKYTPAGGGVVVRVGPEADAAVLSVSDTGPGVPAAEQARVWERLYRGDASRSERGLGLGLSVVRAIVEAHGGRVALRNAPEAGAVFEVRLPLRPQPS
ncbi:sensor histidine kinase [Opitutus terrae]|uniref:sensor histidine kinase n=1 Tax=Opitutus terrae TaxID=107709 RepID=UPI0011D09FBE|nr:HAMP domain-containing sensor histidine kinase [Opitutus terrae]